MVGEQTADTAGPADGLPERMRSRLTRLRADYEAGAQQLAELTRQEAALRETLLRISGAIQVLEELQDAGPADPSRPADGAHGGAVDGAVLRVP